MKIVIWVVVVLVVLWGGYSFLQSPSEPVSTDPIKIGFIGPLTGDAAVYGEPLRNVIQLAVNEINAAGGIGGRQIEMIYEDGKCNGKDGANAMQKLVNVDQVKIVIGGFCSSESLAAAPIAMNNKVLLFSPGSSSPDLSNAGPYFFRNYPSDATQGRVLAEVAYNQKDWQKAAVIQEQLDYPLGVYNVFAEVFTALGGEVNVETFPSGTSDFRTQLTKLKADSPDVLLVSVQTPQAAEIILRQVNELQWEVNLMGVDVIAGSDLPQTNPDLVEGMIVAEFGFDRSNPKFQKFIAAYQDVYGEEPPYLNYAQTEYDSIYILKDAIEAVGEDVDKIVDWLNNLEDWAGVSGLVSFDDNGDVVGGHQPEIIQGGTVVLFEI